MSEPEAICRRATDWRPERLGVKPTKTVHVPRGVAYAVSSVGAGRVVGHERARGQRAAATAVVQFWLTTEKSFAAPTSSASAWIYQAGDA